MSAHSSEPATLFVPELAIEVPDEDGSIAAYIAIDSLVNGRCSGGVRMCDSLDREEIRGLANAMTWKFRFMDNPVGGAKSGINCPAGADNVERERRLKMFGCRVRPVLHSMYALGGDIGVGPDEVAIIKEAAGLPVLRRPGTDRGGYYTAYGVFVSVMTWLKAAAVNPETATAIIEGYGKVGQPLARLLRDANIRIVGVSTERGSVVDGDGLDIDELERLSRVHGASCTEEYGKGDHRSCEELFEQPATIAVPGARAWTIRPDNADELDVQAVIPAANIPVADSARIALEQRGVCVVPDFVSNSGGIFGSGLLNRGFTEDATRRLVSRVFTNRLEALLEKQRVSGDSLRTIAIQACESRQAHSRHLQQGTMAKLRQQMFQKNGLVNVLRRAALEVHYRGFRIAGDAVRHLPNVIEREAEEAVFDRATAISKELRPQGDGGS